MKVNASSRATAIVWPGGGSPRPRVPPARMGRATPRIASTSAFLDTKAEEDRLAGVILNKVGSERHRRLTATAVETLGLPVLGALPRDPGVALPEKPSRPRPSIEPGAGGSPRSSPAFPCENPLLGPGGAEHDRERAIRPEDRLQLRRRCGRWRGWTGGSRASRQSTTRTRQGSRSPGIAEARPLVRVSTTDYGVFLGRVSSRRRHRPRSPRTRARQG